MVSRLRHPEKTKGERNYEIAVYDGRFSGFDVRPEPRRETVTTIPGGPREGCPGAQARWNNVHPTFKRPAGLVTRRVVRDADGNGSVFFQFEWWVTVAIPAGGVVSLDSAINYASSDTVRVTFRSAASDLGNLVAVATWSVPEIDHFNIQDVSLGNKYFFSNSGGGVFSVSGTQFRLILINNGTDVINLNSVLVIARSQ